MELVVAVIVVVGIIALLIIWTRQNRRRERDELRALRLLVEGNKQADSSEATDPKDST
jgi:hypothetical protein